MDRNYFGLERETETGVGGKEQDFQLWTYSWFQIWLHQYFWKGYQQYSKDRKAAGKMTLERNRSESEVKLAKLIQEELFQEYPLNLQKYEFSDHTCIVNL